jgi:predicted nucleic acid-binding protein
MILADTSVLVDFLKGSKTESCDKLRNILQQGIPFGINSFIFQEVLQGAKSEKEYSLLRQYFETQLFYHPKDPIDSFAEAAKIYFKCRKKGVTIRSSIDCIIAQTAMENDLFLLHSDTDFDAMATVVPLKIY